MSQKFCHNCGKKAESVWKACPFCETSFASLQEVPKSQKRPQLSSHQEPTIARVRNQDEYDSDTNELDFAEHYEPKIEALAVEFERPRMSNKESLQSLATNPFSIVSNEQRTPPPAISAEEAIRQFQKEAGEPAKRGGANEVV